MGVPHTSISLLTVAEVFDSGYQRKPGLADERRPLRRRLFRESLIAVDWCLVRTLLQLSASAGSQRPLTRQLSASFIQQWFAQRPEDAVIIRDLAEHPPPAVTEAWVAAAFTEESQRHHDQQQLLATSDALIAELERADLIVLATPMYNYGLPSVLKAWFDQIIRVNKTFSFDRSRGDFPLEPTFEGKKLFILTSSGEFGFGPRGDPGNDEPPGTAYCDLLSFPGRHIPG